jgi:hypothetical protein
MEFRFYSQSTLRAAIDFGITMVIVNFFPQFASILPMNQMSHFANQQNCYKLLILDLF